MFAAVLPTACVQPSVVMEQHHFRHFSCGMNLMKTSSQTVQFVRMVVQSSLLSLYSASATTLQFVVKCCCSCFSFFSLSYASSNRSHIHNCFTVHVEQMLMSGSHLLSFSELALCTTARCFYCTLVCAIFRILSRVSSFFYKCTMHFVQFIVLTSICTTCIY